MATICNFSLPVDEFALSDTFAVCPDAIVEFDQLVEHPATTVLPLVWVRETSPAEFETALDQDATVESYSQLVGTDTEWLYEIAWTGTIQVVCQLLMTEGALILHTVGDSDGWYLRVLFPDHDDVRATTDFCGAHNLSLTIHTIHQFDSDDSSAGTARFGLTPAQREALTQAYKCGYFEVPRAFDLDTLADELDITHQALSERLRRGHQTLIGETLLVGTDSAPAAQPSMDGTDSTDERDTSSMDD